MSILCKHCRRHIPNRTYGEVWKTLLAKGWNKEQIRARSPSCEICADHLVKEDNGPTDTKKR